MQIYFIFLFSILHGRGVNLLNWDGGHNLVEPFEGPLSDNEVLASRGSGTSRGEEKIVNGAIDDVSVGL